LIDVGAKNIQIPLVEVEKNICTCNKNYKPIYRKKGKKAKQQQQQQQQTSSSSSSSSPSSSSSSAVETDLGGSNRRRSGRMIAQELAIEDEKNQKNNKPPEPEGSESEEESENESEGSEVEGEEEESDEEDEEDEKKAVKCGDDCLNRVLLLECTIENCSYGGTYIHTYIYIYHSLSLNLSLRITCFYARTTLLTDPDLSAHPPQVNAPTACSPTGATRANTWSRLRPR